MADGSGDGGGLIEEKLGFPVVVKPTMQGSTVGLSVVRRAEDLPKALALAREYGAENEIS